MKLIQNLILKNNLRKQLAELEQALRLDGYFQKEKELFSLRFNPDEYAVLYKQIEEQYGEQIRQRNQLNIQIRQLSRKNILKSDSDYVH